MFSAAPVDLAEAPSEEIPVVDLSAWADEVQDAGQFADGFTTVHSEADMDFGNSIVELGKLVEASEPSLRHEIVFVSDNVGDYETLLADLQRNDPNRIFEVILLDNDLDGIEQISQVLEQYSDLNAIHLVTHGSGSGLDLGNQDLTIDSLTGYASQISAWSDSLASDADLLIYGCDLASTEGGQALTEALATLVNCDVAASDDLTGHEVLGGDWDLEFHLGTIESSIAFSYAAQADWSEVLATVTFQQGTNGNSGTQDTELDSSAPNTNQGNFNEIEIDDSPTRQALIRFEDLVGHGNLEIPAGSTINSVSLEVNVTGPSSGGVTIGLHRMLVTWDESDTWNSMGSGIQAGSEALVAVDSILGSPAAGGVQTFSSTANLVASVQQWVDDPSTNFGWVIRIDSTDPWKFVASEGAGFKPRLVVDYTAGPGQTVSGAVYEDMNGDGDIADGVGFSNALVKLYRDGGDGVADGVDDVMIGNSLTDVSGNYSFVSLSDDTYWVAVDSTTLSASSGYNGGFDSSDSWAEQTYGSAGSVSFDGSYSYAASDGKLTGGMQLGRSDDASALGTSEHVSRIIVSGSNVTGVDSGFSFDVITRTGDGDESAGSRTMQGSFRQFILNSNAISGVNTSKFVIADDDPNHFYYQDDGVPGSLGSLATTTLDDGSIGDFDPDYPMGPHSWFQIALDDTLPQLTISDQIVIDGYTQTGAVANTQATSNDAQLKIELTNFAADTKRGLTIQSGGAGSEIHGLNITRFGAAAILTDPGADNVVIAGNFIGTDITGTIAVANQEGIHLRSGGNRVGGPSAKDRNIISGNNNRGLITYTFGPIETGNVVQNNFIGVDSSGINPLGNVNHGIQVWNQDGMQILDNVIGDSSTHGIWLRSGATATNTVIQGNMIGVGSDGITSVANGEHGIYISSNTATGTLIGGTGAGQGNVIAANGSSGIMLDGASVSGTTIVGNFIGTDATGTLDLGNRLHGVRLENGSFGNQIGGTGAGEGNTIAFNDRDGISLKNDAGNQNAILGNAIFLNDDLGIDLNDNNQSDNDDDDVDTGANTLLNFPVITSAVTDGASISISGWFKTAPGVANYRLEFFVSDVADPSGHGEGQTFLGFLDVVTDTRGLATFNISIATSVPVGRMVSATATDSSNNTSEFSLARVTQVDNTTNDGLWMSTEGDVSGSGAPGLDSWTDGEVLTFGGPSLELEPGNTAGDFASALNLDLLGDGDVDIDAVHYVSQNVTIGSGGNQINLLAGDLLLSTAADESFFGGAVKVEKRDLFLYRPVVAGQYGVGNIQLVLDMDSPSLAVSPDPDLNFNDIYSVTLVEQDTTLGGYALNAGEILFTRDGGANDQDVYVFHVTDAGEGVTDGTADKLIEGTLLGVTKKIMGMDLVEQVVTVGDETLATGSLLLTIDGSDLVLGIDIDPFNDLIVNTHDVFSVDVTRTEMNGGTLGGGASLVFDGTEVGLDSGAEKLDALSIAILSTNSPPTDITPNAFNINENTDTTGGVSLGTLTTTDPDGTDTFSYSILPGADGAAFSIGGAGLDELIFDESLIDDGLLNHEDRASYTVNVRVTDSVGNTYDETLTVNVNDLNETPTNITPDGVVLMDGTNTTGGLSIVTLTTIDEDSGETFTYSIRPGADGALFSIGGAGLDELIMDDGVLDEATKNSYTVNLRVTDSGGNIRDEVFTVVVSSTPNATPTDISPDNISINENIDTTGGLSVGKLLTSDPDAFDTFTYSILPGADGALFSIGGLANDELILDDGILDFETKSTYTVNLRVTDSGGNQYDETLTINLNDLNEAPTVNDQVFNVDENSPNGTVIGTILAADPDAGANGNLTFSITGGTGATAFAVNSTTGQVTVADTAQLDFESATSLTLNVLVTDSGAPGLADTATITINLNDVAERPQVGNQVFAIAENSANGTLIGTVLATDQDAGDLLSFAITAGDPTGVFSIDAAGNLTVNDGTQLDFEARTSFTLGVTVTDSTLLSDTATITVNVSDIFENTIPLAANDDYIFVSDVPLVVAVDDGLFGNDFDPDAQPLAVSLVSGPSDGTLTLNADGSFSYLSNLGFSGTDSFSYIVHDGMANSNVATVTIEILPGAPAPVAPAPLAGPSPAASDPDTPTATDPVAPADDSIVAPIPVTTPVSVEPVAEAPSKQVVTQAQSIELPQFERMAMGDSDVESGLWLIEGEQASFKQNRLSGLVSLTPNTSLNFVTHAGWYWEQLDEFYNRVESESNLPGILAVGSAGVTTSISVGYVIWLVRGGQIMSGVLAQLPAWRFIDPLPVLAVIEDHDDDAEDDSLKTLVDNASEDNTDPRGATGSMTPPESSPAVHTS